MPEKFRQSHLFLIATWLINLTAGCCFGLVAAVVTSMIIGKDTRLYLISIPIVLTLFVLRACHKTLNILTTQIIVKEDGVLIKSGYIPWSKSNHFMPYNRIYQAGAHTKGFIKWLFKFGTVVIEQHGGPFGRQRAISGMKNAADIVTLINSQVDKQH